MTEPVELPPLLAHSHYVELVEQHEISCELPAAPTEYHRAAIISDTRSAALDWLESEELAATVTHFERRNPPTVGVRFTITVAKAVATPTGSTHQWRWSHRWRAWLNRFASLRRQELHAPRHPIQSAMLAEVVPLHPDGMHPDPNDPT